MSDGSTLPASSGAPTRIGKYRIVRQIAQGGMAEIYLATSTGIEGFEKLCVLKRILPLLAGNQEFVQMFLDEARIAASLLHSNIAQVFDIGEDKGSYYFVMEFLRGEDVRHILQSSVKMKTFVPFEHVVTIITGTCAGLHYAHELKGKDGKPLSIVHRDISPQNVFVTHDGSVKLCDFGIAKSAAQLTETRVGTLKGKIRYMSPEQCQSEPLDRRSDVFALSIVLWELVTLRRLFSGKSDFDVFKAIVESPIPRPSAFRPDIHEGLESIIMKGLARDREERFQSAQDMQIAIEDWSRAERVRTSPVRLAQFMAQLFPAIVSDNYLNKITETDPLGERIKSLNENETSDSGLVDAGMIEPQRSVGAVGVDAGATGVLSTAMPPPLAATPDASSQFSADTSDVRAPLRSRAPLFAIGGALLLLAAAIMTLAMRPRTIPAEHSVVANKPIEAPTDPTPATARDALNVPRVPAAEPVVAAVDAPLGAPMAAPPVKVGTPGTVARTPINKKTSRRAPGSQSTNSKKPSGAYDDFLPP